MQPTATTTAPQPESAACDWDGHDTAIEEHGFCPVCQDENSPGLPDAEETDEPDESIPAGELAAACASGAVKIFRQRANGTSRRVAWLTGAGREHATFARMLTETGASVATVASETGWSRASVRRAVWTLDLMEDIEAGNLDELYEPGDTELVLCGEDEAEGGDA